MEKIGQDVLQRMLKEESSERRLLSSLYVFIPTRGNIKEKIIIFIAMIMPSYLASHVGNTVNLFGDICEIIFNVFISLFGIIFTGYIFFQALLNDELLIILANVKTEKKKAEETKLEEVNKNFVSLMMLYVLAIIISLILIIILPCIPEEFMIFPNNVTCCNSLAWALIQLFYVFTAELIWRVVSFIHNIYQLFNAYAASRLIKLEEANSGEK